MGSLSLVTSELTSPIKEISLQLSLLISPAVRRNNFTMFDSPQMQRAGQRPVSWVNIPITRTVNNIMANVVEELKQQQKHEQQQPQQQSPKRVRWSEELTQGHQPQTQVITIQIRDSTQKQISLALQIIIIIKQQQTQ